MGPLVNDLPAYGDALDGDTLRRLVGHPEQLGGVELLRREDGSERGVRILRVRTGEIEVDVVVDRALDLAGASIRGVPVAWLSPTGITGPWFAEPRGLGTFRNFFGGLLTTCGLEHTLGPTTDEVETFNYPGKTSEEFPLHGRISSSPAQLTRVETTRDGDGPGILIEGTVRQATVFGEALLLERRIEADFGGREIRIQDTVRNVGYAPTPHMILYHVNAGWPLLAPSAEVHLPVGSPRFATEAAAGTDWRRIDLPRPGAAEQVWEHTPSAGPDGLVHGAILNPDVGGARAVGFEIAYDPASLPHLFQWRVMNEGHYVVGLEPGNLRIEGRQVAREAGDLVILEPGQAISHRLSLRLLWGPIEIDAAARRSAPG